jgi:hypothetical protein
MIHMAPPPQPPRSHAVAAAASTVTSPQSNKQAANDEDMFSPTSAAALALSTLHHFGADRGVNQRPQPPTSGLRGTRLFNTSSNTNSNGNGPTAPSSYSSSPPSAPAGRGNGCHYYPPGRPLQHSYPRYTSNRWPELQPRGGIGNPEATPSSSSQPPPWGGVPPHYASRYAPPGPDGSTSYSMEVS